MPRRCSMLEVPDGWRAGIQPSVRRVQVYDAEGRYRSGWYLDNRARLLGSAPGEPGTIVAQSLDWKITFDRKGRTLRREELPDYARLPATGTFHEVKFGTRFFLLPLTNAIMCVVMVVIGAIGLGRANRRRASAA